MKAKKGMKPGDMYKSGKKALKKVEASKKDMSMDKKMAKKMIKGKK